MSTARRPAPPDPEFEDPVAATRWTNVLDDGPHYYQRLVVNPLLAAFGLIVACLAGRQLDRRAAYPAILLFFLLRLHRLLNQAHCLDCGSTFRYSRWKSHACDRVAVRRSTGARRWLRGPSPPSQLLFWVCLMLGVGVIFAALGFL